MVTREFAIKAAEGYRGLDGENENNTGNAFDGTKESYDREMWNALDAVSMLGEEAVNPSSIANAQLRVTSVFAEAGANKKGKAERGLSIEQMMLLEDIRGLISNIDARLEELEAERQVIIEKLEVLDRIDEEIAQGTFDPVNDPEDREAMKFVDPALTDEEIDAMTPAEIAAWSAANRDGLSDRLQVIEETELSLEDLRDELVQLLESDMSFPLHEQFPVANNRFENDILEELAQSLGEDIDRHNLTRENLEQLLEALTQSRFETMEMNDSLNNALGNEVAELEEVVSMNFEIKM